ncbi:MAG: caspase family protein [Ekhidna sp.]|uniref:WD40 domain-containing protein n=1 Tax=Ekhidna sp. TaxID=2608089 RepID=UPI0032EF5E80
MKNLISLLSLLSLCFAGAQSFQAVIQKGHGEAIKSVAFTSNGKFLITVSRDKSVKIWDAISGKEIRTMLGHDHTVNGFAVYEKMIATSSADGTAGVWDMETGQLIWQSKKLAEFVTSVDFSPNGDLLAVGSYADSISIFKTDGFSLLMKIKANADRGVGYGVSVTFSPDGKYLAVGEDNRTAKIYSTTDWSLIYEFKPEAGYCGGCGSITDIRENQLLKLSNGTTFTRYNLSSGKKEWEGQRSFRDIASVEFQPSGDHFLAATEDSVFVYLSKSGKLHSKWSMGAEINDATFHPKEQEIAIAVDKVVVVTDYEGNEIRRYEGILNQSSTGLDYDLGSYWEHYIAKWVKYKPARMLDSHDFYVGKTGSKARKWNVKSASISMEYIGHEKGVLCFERIDQQTMASGAGDGKIIIWNEETGEVIKKINAHREPIFDLTLSNNGKLLASTAWDGVISLWNTETWERYNYIYNEGASTYAFDFTENDAYLVVAMLDKTLKLWEVETKKFVKEFIGHTDNVTTVRVYGDEILSAGWDGSIILWDLYSGLIKKRFKSDKPVFSALLKEVQIISVGADRLVTIWDRNTSGIINQLDGHQAEINGLDIRDNLMMTTDVDGVTKFWDFDERKELFEHIQIGKNDWMVKTPDGYFDATDDAISNIHFVRGMEAVGADQLMEEFYVPGLVKDIFSPSKAGTKSMGQLMDKNPPPVLKLSGLVENETAKLYLKAEDAGGGVNEVRLFHNGKRVPLESQIQKVRSDDNAKIYTIEFPLVAGHNEFMAIASSNANLESNKAKVSLFSDSKVPGSTCHILAVGINEYQNKSLNLNYAKTDASSFATQMKQQGEEIYSKVVLHQIFDRDATKENILAKVSSLNDQISVNDVFVFYYAGHGSMVDGDFYLVSSNASRLYDSDKIDEYGIKASQLQQAMLDIKALKQLIIMDACQSGGSVEVLAQRGAPEEKAIAQLSRSSGIHVMAAAGSEQYATEFESLGHGLFTYALLKGLAGDADGAPKDGKVTIYELKSYLDDQVPELSIKYKGSPQYPHTFSRGQDFPIVIVED